MRRVLRRTGWVVGIGGAAVTCNPLGTALLGSAAGRLQRMEPAQLTARGRCVAILSDV